MRIKVEELVASLQPLKTLFNKEVPVGIGFHLSKTIKTIEDNIKFYDESRNNLIKKYGEELDDGSFNMPIESKDDFQKEFRGLLDSEVEINAEPISISKLEGITMTPADL